METNNYQLNFTMIIFSCDKFSDLWEANINMLKKNWQNYKFDVLLITDKDTNKILDGVTILSAGDESSFSKRVNFALDNVTTKYVFLTLDDYFLIKKVDDGRIRQLVNLMIMDEIDYIRLFKTPKIKTKYKQYNDIFEIIFKNYEQSEYKVNLYPSLWNKDLLRKVATGNLSPWQFEIHITSIVYTNKYKCLATNGKEYEILDVVRKGKLLRKSAKYIKKYQLLKTDREVMPIHESFKYAIINFGNKFCPRFLKNIIRNIFRHFGYKFYRDFKLED